MGTMIKVGQQAPDFSLPTPDSDPFVLSHALKRGPIVLYFYPADFTPVCTAQACMVRDQHDRLQASGHQVVAVSPQTAVSHSAFAEKNDLNFVLLADPEKIAIRLFGVGGPFGLLTRRATFLIDQNGMVTDRVVADLTLGKHRGLLHRALVSAESDPKQT